MIQNIMKSCSWLSKEKRVETIDDSDMYVHDTYNSNNNNNYYNNNSNNDNTTNKSYNVNNIKNVSLIMESVPCKSITAVVPFLATFSFPALSPFLSILTVRAIGSAHPSPLFPMTWPGFQPIFCSSFMPIPPLTGVRLWNMSLEWKNQT